MEYDEGDIAEDGAGNFMVYRYGAWHPSDESGRLSGPIDASAQWGSGARELPNGTIERVGPRGGVTVVANNASGNDEGVGRLTEGQGKAMLYGGMMAGAERDYQRARADGYNPSSIRNQLAEAIPFDNDMIGRWIRDDVSDRGRQAELRWAEGNLRQLTGAAATTPEIGRVAAINFDRGNDELAAQRYQTRAETFRGTRFAAGSGAAALPEYPGMPGAPTETDEYGLPEYGIEPGREIAVGSAPDGPSRPGADAASAINYRDPDSREALVALIAEGGWIRDGDGEPYYVEPGGIRTEAAQEGDQSVAPGVAMRPQSPDAAASQVLGGQAAFSRSALEQVPFGDEMMAGFAGLMSGQGYGRMREAQRGLAAYDRQNNGFERNMGGVAGAVAQAPLGGGAAGRFIANAPRGQAALRGLMVGAGSGAVYGAGADDGSLVERADGARTGAIVGGMTGGVLSGAGRRIGDMVSPAPAGSRREAVGILRDNGVSLTPGQSVGGLAKSAEDLAQRLPIVGTAIRGARERGRDSLNRAVGNRALDNIGEGVPANVPAGGEMVGHVQQRLGAEFDRAYSLVPEIDVNDPDLLQGMARIGQGKADLPPAMQQQFDSIVGERLARLEGAATGQNVGAVRSELNSLASGYLRAQDPAQQALGRMIAELGDELDGAISRASPEAGEILGRAREGYSDYIRLERASTAAGGRPFAAGQLATAVRTSDGTVRHGGVGRGEARMQDLSRAAATVMPDAYGNPGTADTGAWVGLAGLTGANPVAGASVAAGLTAAATPYFAMGRKVVERLPANAGREALQAAANELDQLARQDSNVIVLRDEIARRLAAVSGNAGAAAVNPSPARPSMTRPR